MVPSCVSSWSAYEATSVVSAEQWLSRGTTCVRVIDNSYCYNHQMQHYDGCKSATKTIAANKTTVESYLVLAEPPQPHYLCLQLPYFVLQALLRVESTQLVHSLATINTQRNRIRTSCELPC
jgi:hypothetical protein